ncbi:MAG: bacteriohemerythrin [Desulfobulbaceae bacterium]|nr:bacteriohemerythrin [Desulfobulbaceae bacterium]
MELIKWDAGYSVGVEEIDHQHQHLFKLVNDFIETFGGGHSRDKLRTVLEEMINYIDYHFFSEEKLLKAHPEFEKHRKEHSDFVKKTLLLQGDFIEKGEGINADVLKFLISWLKNHIIGTDVKFFQEL